MSYRRINFLKIFTVIIFASLALDAAPQTAAPTKQEIDAIMKNAVKQMNSQMVGTKIDDQTTLKFVTYDPNPPLFSYFYTATLSDTRKQTRLNQEQIDAIKNYNINKTCSSKFKPLMKLYNLRVAHIFEDKNTGKPILQLIVSHFDC